MGPLNESAYEAVAGIRLGGAFRRVRSTWGGYWALGLAVKPALCANVT